MIFVRHLQEKYLAGIFSWFALCGVCLFPSSAIGITDSIDLQEFYFSAPPESEFTEFQIDTESDPSGLGKPAKVVDNVWKVSTDDRDLRGVLVNWTQAADWQLNWGVAGAIQVEQGAVFEGDFVMAVHDMISTLAADRVFAIADSENRIVTIISIGGK